MATATPKKRVASGITLPALENPADIKVDEEFRSLCPALSTSERDLLEASIIEHGVRDPLIIWNGILVDGHHRREIAIAHKLSVAVRQVSLADRDQVRGWILRNQLGRRNLTRIQAGYLRGVYYRSARQPNGRKKKGEEIVCTGDAKQVADIVAKLFRVSRSTIQADLGLADAIDSMSPNARRDILSGNVITYPSYIRQLAAIPVEYQEQIAERAATGEKGAVAKGLAEWVGSGGTATVKCRTCYQPVPVGQRCMHCVATQQGSLDRAVRRGGANASFATANPFNNSPSRKNGAAENTGMEIVRLCHDVMAWLDATPREKATPAHIATMNRLHKQLGRWIGDE